MRGSIFKKRESRVGPDVPRRRLLRRLVLGLVAVCAVWTLWRLTSNFPASWERRISRSLSSDGMDVKVDGVSFSFPQMRLSVNSVALFPKGEVRSAALSVKTAAIRLRPRSLSPSLGWVREVRLDSLDFDVAKLSCLSGGSSGADESIPALAPTPFSIRRVSGIGLELRDLFGTLSSAGGVLSIDDASVSFHGRGEPEQTLKGRISVDPSEPSVDAFGSGLLDFSKLAPTLRELDCPGIAAELAKFEFPARQPQVNVRFCWTPPRQTRSLGVSLESGPMRYNGVRLSALSGDIRVGGGESWNRVDIDPLEVRRPEGGASGYLSIDIDKGALSFDCSSSLDPLRLAEMTGLLKPGSLPDVEFEGPVDIRCSGNLGIGEGGDEHTSVKVSASAPAATARGFRFSQIAVSGGVNGSVIDFPRISAQAMDGTLKGSFKVSGFGDDRTVSASLSVSEVPQAQWAFLLGREADAQAGGTLNMGATYDGPFAELGGKVPMRGHGTFSADIHDARLFRIPLFAGLTDILVTYIPGVNFLVDQSEGQVRASLDEGRWNLSSLSVSGAAFSIDGSGTASADGSEIDIVARVRLMNKRTWLGRLVQRLLSPISGLFGVRASGSFDSPRWTLAPFSKSSAK